MWTVEEQPTGEVEFTPDEYDRRTDTRGHNERLPIILNCSIPSKPGIVFEVHGTLTTTRWQRGETLGRHPWTFEMGQYVGIRFVGPPTSESVKDAGIGPLHRAVKAYYRDLARELPEWWGEAHSLPAPGQKGHPEGHYALWAKRYLDAVEQYGRGYLSKLNKAYPTAVWTKQNLSRTVIRAEDLGLCEIVRSSGRLNTGRMTDKGNALLKEAGEL